MRTALQLGATLYIPATRPDLPVIAHGHKFGELRSVIFCTEDAIAPQQVEPALQNLRVLLQDLGPSSTMRFIRVRNPRVLARILAMPGSDRLDGFVLPKINRRLFAEYAEMLPSGGSWKIMPTLETKDVFDPQKLMRLRKQFDASHLRDRILAIRIGGNDLMNLLGIRRMPGGTIYDTPLGLAISQVIQLFRPAQYNLTAPVFDQLQADETLSREVERDISWGLLSKTAIHPTQIARIENGYRVAREELAAANAVLEPSAPPVFRFNGCMYEPATQREWANSIVARSQIFGVREDFALPMLARAHYISQQG